MKRRFSLVSLMASSACLVVFAGVWYVLNPRISRLLTELGHKVIVAHAQKVQLAHCDAAPTPTARDRSPDGDPGAGRTGACSNSLGERGTRVSEVLWAAAAQVWLAAGEPGAGHVFLPYVRAADGDIQYGEIFATKRNSTVFLRIAQLLTHRMWR
jgi:hypothetical protein